MNFRWVSRLIGIFLKGERRIKRVDQAFICLTWSTFWVNIRLGFPSHLFMAFLLKFDFFALLFLNIPSQNEYVDLLTRVDSNFFRSPWKRSWRVSLCFLLWLSWKVLRGRGLISIMIVLEILLIWFKPLSVVFLVTLPSSPVGSLSSINSLWASEITCNQNKNIKQCTHRSSVPRIKIYWLKLFQKSYIFLSSSFHFFFLKIFDLCHIFLSFVCCRNQQPQLYLLLLIYYPICSSICFFAFDILSSMWWSTFWVTFLLISLLIAIDFTSVL